MRDPHQIAAARNARLHRKDIEWAVGPTGLYLRDRADWTAERTRQLEAQIERERDHWKRASTQ